MNPNECFQHLTKREYFAGLAMQGILQNPETISRLYLVTISAAASVSPTALLAKAALLAADELLKELNNAQPG